jgi:lipopolysaccharide/colanic/teichoic acid biosynthesis glycosyltransferase
MRTLTRTSNAFVDVDTLPQEGARQPRYLPAKRVFDLVFCIAILLPVAVVAAICAVAVWLESPGPVVYSQLRIGKDGRPFRMYKFRTMVQNAEELKASLAHLNVLPPPDFKIPDDPRVTRVGRFLRRTSLDELPQFVNVLKGDMSIVGPRPAEDGMDTYRLWYGERLEVPPGITGIWQLEGRAAISFDARLRYDLEYIRTMSLWLDMKLIIRTVGVIFQGTGI